MPYNRTGALRKIHIVGKQNGLDHEALRDVAISLFALPRDKASLGGLSNTQLDSLIQHLTRQPGAPAPRPGPTPVRATHRQLWKIRQQTAALGWNDDPTRLPGFLDRQTNGHTRHLHDLTPIQASAVIDGLKNLLRKANL